MNHATTHRHVEKTQKPATIEHEVPEHEETEGPLTAYMSEHSWPKITAGVAVAAVGGLLAVSFIGAAPAAIAGAAGYLAWREMTGKKNGAKRGSNR